MAEYVCTAVPEKVFRTLLWGNITARTEVSWWCGQVHVFCSQKYFLLFKGWRKPSFKMTMPDPIVAGLLMIHDDWMAEKIPTWALYWASLGKTWKVSFYNHPQTPSTSFGTTFIMDGIHVTPPPRSIIRVCTRYMTKRCSACFNAPWEQMPNQSDFSLNVTLWNDLCVLLICLCNW